MSNRGKIKINKAAIGYWWSVVGHFGPATQGWRLTQDGAIKAGRRFKKRYERSVQRYNNPDLLVD